MDDCVAKGAKVLIGGKPNAALNSNGGTFFEATVLTGVTRDMLPFNEETFGPVAALMKFKTEQEALDIANDTR